MSNISEIIVKNPYALIGYSIATCSDEDFEHLIILILKKLFGEGVRGFAKGRDGGKDGAFMGKANSFPSETKPWEGYIIIQAKHVGKTDALITEGKFFNPENESSIVSQESKKIKRLVLEEHVTHYFLATNRTITGGSDDKVLSFISNSTTLPKDNICIYDNLQIIDFIIRNPDVYLPFYWNEPTDQLEINQELLAEIITSLSWEFKTTQIDSFPTERISYENKNKLNNVNEAFAEAFAKRGLKYVYIIDNFLNNPRNTEIREKYEELAEEVDLQLALHVDNGNKYPTLLIKIIDIFNRIVKNRKLASALVFYMYWSCDIGTLEAKNAETKQTQ